MNTYGIDDEVALMRSRDERTSSDLDVLYTIAIDGLGHIIIRDANNETLSTINDDIEWSVFERADVVGEELRRAMADEL